MIDDIAVATNIFARETAAEDTYHLTGSGGISCEEKQIILDEHNRLRQLVALGQIHGQPSAENMMEMIWDDELAAIAQRWADRCAETHDSLRNVRK
ncbi:Venom allergen 5 [Harpegnathos saltator]|uniref:Venom allergen 5 n=1 Tax=Harpegnathos saltator TaxID=610380 RepID=E2C0M8_HARSA|nr:Venom allergen 5 [Harpegnathos saltator]